MRQRPQARLVIGAGVPGPPAVLPPGLQGRGRRVVRSRDSENSGGFGMLELAIVLAIIGVMLVLLLPRLTSRPLHLAADSQEFVANLEVARSLARSRTRQYRLEVTSTSQYVIQREATAGGGWTETERTVTLRPGVVFAAGSVGQAATFDSRGRLVGSAVTFAIVDSVRGWSRQVLVRTTGMVETQ